MQKNKLKKQKQSFEAKKVELLFSLFRFVSPRYSREKSGKKSFLFGKIEKTKRNSAEKDKKTSDFFVFYDMMKITENQEKYRTKGAMVYEASFNGQHTAF